MTKTIIITGANSGLGFETTKQIAEQGRDYHLIMACRNMTKASAARDEILKAVPDVNLTCLELDTSSLAKVRDFFAAFRALDEPLYGLVCNAGIAGRNATVTADGFNNIFETNYLGHFLLTQLLLPLMHDDSRIVTISSERHDTPLRGVAWPGVEAIAYPGRDAMVDQRSYVYSKLCAILFTYELDRRLMAAGKSIVVNTVNPGLMVETGLSKNKSRFTPEMMAQVADLLSTAKDSATMVKTLMVDDKFAKGPARYFDRSSDKPIRSSKMSYDQQIQDELWDFSMKAVGLAK